jgi:uncharacterized membrane protein
MGGGGSVPPPAGGAPFNVGDPFSFGWKKFTEAPVPWILLVLLVMAGLAVVGIVGFILVIAASGNNFFLGLLVSAFFSFVLLVVVFALQYGLLRSALGATQGEVPDFKKAWDMDAFGNYIITAVLVSLIVGVLSIFCYIPGLIAAFLLLFAPFFAIDKKSPPVENIKASFQLVTQNLGTVLVFAILAYLVYLAGVVVCFVGVLITAPIALIAAAFVYKRMTNQPISA